MRLWIDTEGIDCVIPVSADLPSSFSSTFFSGVWLGGSSSWSNGFPHWSQNLSPGCGLGIPQLAHEMPVDGASFSGSGVISSSGMFWASSWDVVIGVAIGGGDGALSAGMSCGVAGGGVIGVGVSFSGSGIISSSGMFWTSSWDVVVGVATGGGDGALSAGISRSVADGVGVIGVSICGAACVSGFPHSPQKR